VLALVVQHCPAVNTDPRALCTLLQVSAACRTALQHTHGSCRIVLQASEQNLVSYAAWLPQHTRLMSESHVDCSTSTDLSDPSEASSQFAAALEQLSNLRSLVLTSSADYTFSDEVISILSCASQLTHVHIEKLGVSALSSLPQSLLELDVKVDVPQLVRVNPKVSAERQSCSPEVCLSLQHLTLLRRCGVWVPSTHHQYACRGFSAEACIILQLPSQLTALHLTGSPITQVVAGEDQEGLFSNMVAFSASGAAACSLDMLAGLIRRMPQLISLCLDGFLTSVGFMGTAALSVPAVDASLSAVSAPAAEDLALALAAATSLTAVSIWGYSTSTSFEDVGVGWGAGLAHLQGLKDLYLCIPLCDDDLLALFELTNLTSLRLERCSEEVDQPAIESLCEELTQLQVLSITGSGLESSCGLFPTLLQLTDLRVLILDYNYCMTCTEADLWSLTNLVSLTELTLPPYAFESCLQSAFGCSEVPSLRGLLQDFMAEMPGLQRLSCAGMVCNRAESMAGEGWSDEFEEDSDDELEDDSDDEYEDADNSECDYYSV